MLVIEFNLVPHIKGRTQPELENRVLRNIFEPKRKDVTGRCRKLRNDDIHEFYSSKNIIREVKDRRMVWKGYVASM